MKRREYCLDILFRMFLLFMLINKFYHILFRHFNYPFASRFSKGLHISSTSRCVRILLYNDGGECDTAKLKELYCKISSVCHGWIDDLGILFFYYPHRFTRSLNNSPTPYSHREDGPNSYSMFMIIFCEFLSFKILKYLGCFHLEKMDWGE